MKALVTGGAGFLGSHVVDELLKRGNDVVILDNFTGPAVERGDIPKETDLIIGSLTDKSACNEATKDVDVVFHTAAHAAEGQSVYIPIYNATTNILGSLTLLVAAINNNVEKIVFTSSIAAYGRPQHLPIKETQPLNPEDPYGVTKLAFENYLRVYYELGQIKPFIVRFFNVYGPRQRMNDPYRGVVPIFINKCLRGERPLIFGDGSQKRAFTYVSDIVEPICDIIEKEKLVNSPINIGSEEVCTVKDLAEKIIKKTGVSLKPEFVPERTSDVKETYCDVSKAKLLGYKAKVSLDEGLEKTIEWARKEGKKEFNYIDVCEIKHLQHKVYKERKI